MSRANRLWIVLGLNLALVGGLVAVGTGAHSLAVFAEGADYLADAAAIGVALLALWLGGRPPTPRRPHGYPRASAYAALVNAGWLLTLEFLIIAASTDRLARGPHHVHGLPVLIVSGVAAAAMIVGALILGRDLDDLDAGNYERLSVQAVLLDTAADGAAAAAVAITGVVILVSGGLYWLDPTAALLVSAIIAYHTIRLLGRVIPTLRRAPTDKPA